MAKFEKIPIFLSSLESSIERIIDNFIGEYIKIVEDQDNPDPFAGIDDKQKQEILLHRIRGTVLVIHSEVQSFLEFLGKAYINKAHSIYKEDGKITEMFLFFLTTSPIVFPNSNQYTNPSSDLPSTNSKQEIDFKMFNGIEERFDCIYKSYCDNIAKNYGIKEKNLVRIFNPLGITYEELHEMKIFTLANEYGNIRGDFAHETFARSKYLPGIMGTDSSIILDVKGTEKK